MHLVKRPPLSPSPEFNQRETGHHVRALGSTSDPRTGSAVTFSPFVPSFRMGAGDAPSLVSSCVLKPRAPETAMAPQNRSLLVLLRRGGHE